MKICLRSKCPEMSRNVPESLMTKSAKFAKRAKKWGTKAWAIVGNPKQGHSTFADFCPFAYLGSEWPF